MVLRRKPYGKLKGSLEPLRKELADAVNSRLPETGEVDIEEEEEEEAEAGQEAASEAGATAPAQPEAGQEQAPAAAQ